MEAEDELDFLTLISSNRNIIYKPGIYFPVYHFSLSFNSPIIPCGALLFICKLITNGSDFKKSSLERTKPTSMNYKIKNLLCFTSFLFSC